MGEAAGVDAELGAETSLATTGFGASIAGDVVTGSTTVLVAGAGSGSTVASRLIDPTRLHFPLFPSLSSSSESNRPCSASASRT